MQGHLIIGTGIYSVAFVHLVRKCGKTISVVDERPNIANLHQVYLGHW